MKRFWMLNIQRDGFRIPTTNVVYQQYISINEKSFGDRYNPIILPWLWLIFFFFAEFIRFLVYVKKYKLTFDFIRNT